MGNDNQILKPEISNLGTATTIGELRELIKNYPDETSFGFRNQAMQELHEVKYPDETFVVFQPNEPNPMQGGAWEITIKEGACPKCSNFGILDDGTPCPCHY